jgi:hypothetical protein
MMEDGVGCWDCTILSGSQVGQLGEEFVDLVLESGDVVAHLLELGAVLERVRTAVGSIYAFQLEIAASLARCLAVTFDFTSLALITGDGDVAISLGPGMALAIVVGLSLLSLRRRLR